MRNAQVAVIGDSDASASTCRLAEHVGEFLAKHKITVITGGRSGVMEAASRGAARAGGVTVGILPSEHHMDANPWCSIVIPTGLSHARNVMTVLAGDVVVVLGGSAGTLSEICLAWIHDKPIVTIPDSGGWAEKLAGATIDHRRSQPIISCGDVEQLELNVLDICRALNLSFTG